MHFGKWCFPHWRWLCACALAVCGSGAWAAGANARPDGAAGGLDFFTTSGQLDSVFARIDGGLWYSSGGPFVNIGAGIGGATVQTNDAPSRDFQWAGSDAGFWVTFDRGATWQARNTGLTCLDVKNSVVNNISTIYVSTRCNNVDTVFRSFDRGLTWQQMTALPGAPRVSRLERAADTTQSRVFAHTTVGRLRADDTSTAWTTDQSVSGSPFRSAPANTETIASRNTSKAVCIILVRNVGPYRTANCPIGGTNQPAAVLQIQGLPTLTAFGSVMGLVNNEALVPILGDGVYRFSGTSWVRDYPNSKVPGIQNVRDITTGSSTLLATSTTSGVWRSTDSGVTWQPFGLAGSSSAGAAPAPVLVPVTPPPQTTFTAATGQLPAAAISSVAATADTSALTLVVELDLSRILSATLSQSFAAVSGYNVYVIALVRLSGQSAAAGVFQLDAESNWGALANPIKAFAEGVATGAADQRVRLEILRSNDVNAIKGTEFYVGYGTSDAEMLQAQRYRGVFIIP